MSSGQEVKPTARCGPDAIICLHSVPCPPRVRVNDPQKDELRRRIMRRRRKTYPRLVVVKDKRPTHQTRPWRVLIYNSRQEWDYRLVSRTWKHEDALHRGLYELDYEIRMRRQIYENQLALENDNRLAEEEWGWRD